MPIFLSFVHSTPITRLKHWVSEYANESTLLSKTMDLILSRPFGHSAQKQLVCSKSIFPQGVAPPTETQVTLRVTKDAIWIKSCLAKQLLSIGKTGFISRVSKVYEIEQKMSGFEFGEPFYYNSLEQVEVRRNGRPYHFGPDLTLTYNPLTGG